MEKKPGKYPSRDLVEIQKKTVNNLHCSLSVGDRVFKRNVRYSVPLKVFLNLNFPVKLRLDFLPLSKLSFAVTFDALCVDFPKGMKSSVSFFKLEK